MKSLEWLLPTELRSVTSRAILGDTILVLWITTARSSHRLLSTREEPLPQRLLSLRQPLADHVAAYLGITEGTTVLSNWGTPVPSQVCHGSREVS